MLSVVRVQFLVARNQIFVKVIVKRIEQFLKSNKNPEKMEKGANSQNIHYMFNNLLKKIK